MKTIPLNPSSPSDISAEAGKNGARRATGVPASAGPSVPVDPEVVEKKPRNMAEKIQRVRKRSRKRSLFGVCFIALQIQAAGKSAIGFHLQVF